MIRATRARLAVAALVATFGSLLGAGAAHATSEVSNLRAPLGAGAGCAWPIRADRSTLNVAYPDTDATYWFQRYSLAPGERIQYRWTRPDARYSSLVVYDATGTPLTSLPDRDVGFDARARTTVTLAPGPIAGAGMIASAPVGASGRSEGGVIYRVYVPDRPGDRQGGAPLPTATLVRADGRRTRIPTCARSAASPDIRRTIAGMDSITSTPVPPTPVFIRPRNDGGNLYPNPDNTYVATIVDHRPGRIVVIRGRAPTFPDTRAGAPITGEDQLRYWSFCTNEYAKPYRTSDCRNDARVATKDGEYTIVVSTRADRPKGIGHSAGVTWLPWGTTGVPALILMREMLPNPTYAEAASHLALGQPAVPGMGAYAPRAVYCATSTFSRGGAAACGI